MKYEKYLALIDAFVNNESILHATKRLDIHYSVGKDMYQKIRFLIINHAQETYTHHIEPFSQYEEFYYLPSRKKGDKKYFFDAVGIFGMLYDTWVYTLLLPDQLSTFRKEESMEHEAYARYIASHKMVHITSFKHRLEEFWNFFETFMAHFKGVKKENLVYYLKEAEFKFNYSKHEQKEILMRLWKQNM